MIFHRSIFGIFFRTRVTEVSVVLKRVFFNEILNFCNDKRLHGNNLHRTTLVSPNAVSVFLGRHRFFQIFHCARPYVFSREFYRHSRVVLSQSISSPRSPTAATNVLLCHMENATHVRPPPIVLKYSVGVRARPRVFLNNFRTLINGQWPWLEKKKRKNAYILRRGHTNYVFRPDKSIRSRLSCRNLHVLCFEKKNNFSV